MNLTIKSERSNNNSNEYSINKINTFSFNHSFIHSFMMIHSNDEEQIDNMKEIALLYTQFLFHTNVFFLPFFRQIVKTRPPSSLNRMNKSVHRLLRQIRIRLNYSSSTESVTTSESYNLSMFHPQSPFNSSSGRRQFVQI